MFTIMRVVSKNISITSSERSRFIDELSLGIKSIVRKSRTL